MKKLAVPALAAAVLVIAAALFVIFRPLQPRLVLTNEDTGQTYLSIPVHDGDRFSVTFKHSVHLTPVIETYEIRGSDIYVVEAKFYTFGAGMQSDFDEGLSYTYDDDGGIVVTGYNTLCKDLIYCISKVYDHVLEYDGMEYSLASLCGRGSLVRFSVKTP